MFCCYLLEADEYLTKDETSLSFSKYNAKNKFLLLINDFLISVNIQMDRQTQEDVEMLSHLKIPDLSLTKNTVGSYLQFW